MSTILTSSEIEGDGPDFSLVATGLNDEESTSCAVDIFSLTVSKSLSPAGMKLQVVGFGKYLVLLSCCISTFGFGGVAFG